MIDIVFQDGLRGSRGPEGKPWMGVDMGGFLTTTKDAVPPTGLHRTSMLKLGKAHPLQLPFGPTIFIKSGRIHAWVAVSAPRPMACGVTSGHMTPFSFWNPK